MNRLTLKPHLVLLSLPLLLLAPGGALAQQRRPLPGFELERMQLEPSGLGSLVTGTGRTLAAGMLRTSVQAHYTQLPLSFGEEWAPVSIPSVVEDRLTLHVAAAYGVLSWLQVDAQLPFIAAQKGSLYQDVARPAGSGLGTPWLGVRAALLRRETGAPLNLALGLTAGLPVGRAEALGRDDYALTPRLQLGYSSEHIQVGGEAALHLRPRHDLTPYSRSAGGDVVGNELRLGATVTSRGGDTTRGEVTALLGVPLAGGRMSLEVLIGIRRHLSEGVDLFVLGGPGLGAALDLPTYRLLAGASFSTGRID